MADEFPIAIYEKETQLVFSVLRHVGDEGEPIEVLLIKDHGIEKDFEILLSYYKGEKKKEAMLKPVEHDTSEIDRIIWECNKKEDYLMQHYSIVYDDVPRAIGRINIPLSTAIGYENHWRGKLLVQRYRAVNLYIHEGFGDGGILVAEKILQKVCIDEHSNCAYYNFYPYADEYVVKAYRLEDWQLRLLLHIYFEYDDLLRKAFDSMFRDFQKYWVYTGKRVSKALVVGAFDVDRNEEYKWGSCDNEVIIGNIIICPILQ